MSDDVKALIKRAQKYPLSVQLQSELLIALATLMQERDEARAEAFGHKINLQSVGRLTARHQSENADLRARLTAAQEENAKLRKALEPFTGYVVRGIYHKGVDRRTPQIEREAVWEITLPASSQQPMFKHFDDARAALPDPQPKEPSP